MLVLSRKQGQKIIINGNIVLTVIQVEGGKIRLGIDAPKDVSILREELTAFPVETSPEAMTQSPGS